MNFEKALEAMKTGKKVKRKVWDVCLRGQWIKIVSRDAFKDEKGFDYDPESGGMDATDWVFLVPKKKVRDPHKNPKVGDVFELIDLPELHDPTRFFPQLADHKRPVTRLDFDGLLAFATRSDGVHLMWPDVSKGEVVGRKFYKLVSQVE